MIINNFIVSITFKVFIEHFYCRSLCPETAVFMDDLHTHQLALIEYIIKSVGSKVINLFPY